MHCLGNKLQNYSRVLVKTNSSRLDRRARRCRVGEGGQKAPDRHLDRQTNRQTFMVSLKMHPKEDQRPSGHKVHQIRGTNSICQTPNCAKFCNNPTRSVQDIHNQKFVPRKSGPKFTKFFYGMLLYKTPNL